MDSEGIPLPITLATGTILFGIIGGVVSFIDGTSVIKGVLILSGAFLGCMLTTLIVMAVVIFFYFLLTGQL